ncbi:unnamed protein product [Chilo suppressalis]|uniref:Serpin domain-containing protein n=1 Tax=Chilo suppressalis TaxID=168631 RepID=A0ABN8B0M0_CHISP|nr:unnamed protein product [Chilo suppressalis]
MKKFIKITETLKAKTENQITSKIFHTASVKKFSANFVEVVKRVNFKNGSANHLINNCVKENVQDLVLGRTLPADTDFALVNIHTYKDVWKRDNSKFPCTKVYNSFNYTQDIQYETRLIELSTIGEFKLVILVPNESDVLQGVFEKLTTDGLQDTVDSILPIFTTTTQLSAPNISINSTLITQEQNSEHCCECMQHGIVTINSEGIETKVLTCLYKSSDDKTSQRKQDKNVNKEAGFYFAILFKDVALFTGQYLNNNNKY